MSVGGGCFFPQYKWHPSEAAVKRLGSGIRQHTALLAGNHETLAKSLTLSEPQSSHVKWGNWTSLSVGSSKL